MNALQIAFRKKISQEIPVQERPIARQSEGLQKLLPYLEDLSEKETNEKPKSCLRKTLTVIQSLKENDSDCDSVSQNSEDEEDSDEDDSEDDDSATNHNRRKQNGQRMMVSGVSEEQFLTFKEQVQQEFLQKEMMLTALQQSS